MKFGPEPVTSAAGGILAHSMNVAGTRLRKGRILTKTDIAGLVAAGIETITVARLGAEDIHEDQAAAFFAKSLRHPGDSELIRLSSTFTGRVNLYACANGIAILDAEAIARANAVNPMISVATVAPYARMRADGMLATIKIISYGVPVADLEKASALAAGAVRVQPAVYNTASLIITQTSSDDASKVEAKGIAAIRTRLAALDVTLSDVATCAHATDAIATALTGATGQVCLILTASATSDPLDVAPEGLRRAGGTMTRFGMPVDPGNLLFFGALGEKPVIGLPGCVRSPVLNGADWVMERLLCGVSVTSADIAAMGVGGLLKEIPSRPQPRDGKNGSG